MLTLRRHCWITAFFAVVSLLFMQLAVASYVCPSGEAQGTASRVTASHAGMPCAQAMAASQAMDQGQPGLCKAHCQADQQSADTYQLPSLPVLPAIPADFPPVLDGLNVAHATPLQAVLLQRSTAPPLSVQHCCFRI